MDCLFCKLIAGEIPSKKVYEDDEVLAFHDIEPQAPFHILIIPKQHIESAADVSPNNSAVIAKVFEVAAQIARDNNLVKGFRLVTNVGVDGNQTVKHLHFHMFAGRLLGWPPG